MTAPMERLSADTLRLILDTMVEGVVLHDATGDVIWANPSAARILGSSVLLSVRTSGANEVPWSAVREDGEPLPWDDHPAMTALHTGIPQRDVVMGVQRPDGARRWVSVNADPVVHGNQRVPAAVVVTYADITAIREGALKLRALESQLRHAQKMEAVGQLTGGIAHDFNNLLTAIITNADLLMDEVSSPDAIDELNDLRRAARRGAELVRKLMVFARRERTELTRLDLAEHLYDAARLLRRVVAESIEIQTNVEAGLPAIQADPAGLEQVLVNLATNARDAMPEGGVLRIQAELRMMEQAESDRIDWGRPGPYVCLTVSDTGVGMDDATLSRIFDPFFTTKPVGSGTGLGMSIVYGMVQQHGGYIHVVSTPGEGTNVEMRFVPAEPAAPVEEPDETAEVRGGTETILLVEDNEGVRSAARRILERRGYRVVSATTGEDAVQLYEVHRNEVALILADVVMPRMGGFELVRTLRRQGRNPKFLLTSGYTQRAGDAAALEVPLLAKPWTPVVLARKVREVLDGGRLTADGGRLTAQGEPRDPG
jgi:signal transduction histidine kinase